MNIDDKIKQQLKSEADEIDRILATENKGLFSMMNDGFKGSLRPWFILVNVITVLNSILLIYCGYQFFTASSTNMMFWGIVMLLSFQFQVAAKQWLMSEVNRSNLMREIKRVELAVAELDDKLTNQS